MTTPKLALIPCGYKGGSPEGTLYSVLPTDGSGDFTVSRASKKHKINSDLELEIIENNVPALNYDAIGGCPVLNTEPQATNLITYPISFGNSYWTKSGTSIQGDPSTAGAEKVTNGGFSTDTDWTKGSGWTIGSGVATVTSGNNGDDLVQDIGLVDGTFYKIEVTISGYVAGSLRMNFLGTGGSIGDFTANGSYVGYAYGGSDTRLQIVATTTTTTLSIDNVSVKEVQGYSAPSVDFPTSAFKLVEDTSTGIHILQPTTPIVTVVSTSYSLSAFYKIGERPYAIIGLHYNTSIGCVAEYEFSTDTFVYSGAAGTNYSISNLKSIVLANGFVKLSCTVTTGHTVAFPSFGIHKDLLTSGIIGNNVYTGDGTSGVYIFMAQFEQSSVATSPTFTDTTLASEGSTTTRLADSVTGAGDATLFSDINTSGVLFAEISALSDYDTIYRAITINDGTTSNRIDIQYTNSTNIIRVVVTNAGAELYSQTLVSTVTDFHKIAVRYKNADFSFYVDGVEINNQLSGVYTPPTYIDLNLDASGGVIPFYGNTKSIQVFPYLTDAELITLTTP